MLDVFLTVTSVLTIISGVTVMALGDWRPHILKFSGIVISTGCAIFLTFIHLTNNVPDVCATSSVCLEYVFYGAIRNCTFIIFHIATGRDAIRLRRCDRRCRIAQIDRRNAA